METVLRVALVYIFIMFALRVLGKRDFSQLTPFDLVTILLIPELVQQALVREDFSMTNGLIALSTLFTLVFITSCLSHVSKRFRTLTESQPTVLVQDGKLIEKHLNQQRIPPDEIYGEMHKVGLDRIEQVQWGILETDGRISFIPRFQEEKQIKKGQGEEFVA